MTSNQPTMRKFITNCLNALDLLGSRVYSGKMKFGPIPADVSEDMERQRAFVAKLLSQHFPGKHLAGSTEDFAILHGSSISLTRSRQHLAAPHEFHTGAAPGSVGSPKMAL